MDHKSNYVNCDGEVEVISVDESDAEITDSDSDSSVDIEALQ
jgi:hypothetical protein